MGSSEKKRGPDPESELIWNYFGRRQDGFFIEVGANHPFEGSQTYFLEQQGWRGILVEPVPESCALLRQERSRSQVVQAACGSPEQRGPAEFHVARSRSLSGLQRGLVVDHCEYERVESVEVRTLDEIIEEAGRPHIHFLSIDVEGAQLDVLRGLDLAEHGPDLLLVEDHLFGPATHLYLRRQGLYRLVRRRVRNNWYIPRDQTFGWSSLYERIQLFRKVWLSPPFRRLRRRIKHGRAHGGTVRG